METRSRGARRAEGKAHVGCRHKRRIQRPGHYAMQCLLRKGKSPAVNTITTDIQQVTTRQQAKNADWAAEDELCRTTKEWVKKANAANAERMKQESALLGPMEEDFGSPNPVWEALAGCGVILTMEKPLKLVPRFRRAIEDQITR